MFFDLPEAFIFVGVLQNCFVTTETFLVLVFFVFIYNQNGILIYFIPLPLLSPWLLLTVVCPSDALHPNPQGWIETKLKLSEKVTHSYWELRNTATALAYNVYCYGGRAVHSDDTWVPCCNCTFWDFLFLYLICFWNAERVIACCHVFVGVLCCDSREENQEWNTQRQKKKNTKKGSQVRQIICFFYSFFFFFPFASQREWRDLSGLQVIEGKTLSALIAPK